MEEGRGLRYYMYLIPVGMEVEDAVVFVYVVYMHCDVQNKREVAMRYVDFLYQYGEKEGAHNNGSKNIHYEDDGRRGREQC